MLKIDPDVEIAKRIQMLLDLRQQHADALGAINQTLSSVAAALGMASSNGHPKGAVEPAVAAPAKKRRGRPPGVRNATAPTVARNKGRHTRGGYVTTGDDLILAFIKQHKNPATREIKDHWASEGRRGTADNVLSKLFREKKVKRTPLGKGIRGSRYSVI